MSTRISRRAIPAVAFILLVAAVAITLQSAPGNPYSTRSKAFYAARELVAFVRPGLTVTVNSAEIAADGTISTVFTLADPAGAPLDRQGVTTPGAVSLSFVAARIPNGQTQYVAYTTRRVSGAAVSSTEQAASDTGGTYTMLADGRYRYVFGMKAPSGFDRSATHTIGIYGSRNLQEFELGTNYASTTFNFVPDGSPVRTVRDVIRTESCNRCHDQLSAHGGSRRGLDMCVLCHTPQTTDPDTGNSVDMKVMVHKIHMGSSLPSVQAGRPYRVIGFGGAVLDWSTVVFPSGVRRCESCHQQNTGATQANAYLTRPTRDACGSCHDDVNFATGENHVAGPQISDNQCATCHIPQGELEFDASIKGAHLVPQDSASLSGLALDILRVEDGVAGRRPIVTFTVKNKAGAAVPLSSLNNVSLVMAGPARDYGYVMFQGATTPGYVSESAMNASCGSDGTCRYTFQRPIPADASGTYSIGIEARRTETLLAGTTEQMNVQYGARNEVFHFSVDGSPVQPRRTVVETAKCNQCHTNITAHGENRNEVAMCVLCHNPSLTDVARRPMAQNPDEVSKPPQGVNFNLLIHRIHSGERLKGDGKSYTVIGFGGALHDFTEVRYPALSPQGSPGDTRNCAMCHVNGSEQVLTGGFNDVLDPQGPINPVKPVTSACTGCHVSTAAASHALINTSVLGESCAVCHASTSEFSVGKAHAQY
jgi:OmcA/MtrC family decaheme c-type cytochrome